MFNQAMDANEIKFMKIYQTKTKEPPNKKKRHCYVLRGLRFAVSNRIGEDFKKMAAVHPELLQPFLHQRVYRRRPYEYS